MPSFNYGADGSDGLANAFKYYIDFFHIPSGESVQFKAFLTSFDDSFESEWNSEEVYGRMDPIQSFKGTKRSISLEWELVAGSMAEAKDNLQKCTTLFGMLYPIFSGGDAATKVVSNPPLMRIRFVNLLRDAATGGAAGGSAESTGLVCTVDGFNYSPDIDAGFLHEGPGIVYPQSIKLSCGLTVMHTHGLGYSGQSRRQDTFPYGDKPSAPGTNPATGAGNTAAGNDQQTGAANQQMTLPPSWNKAGK